jgi:NADH:ubiquinone oxidoreductase subunit 3 (subunit A)
MLSFRPAKEIAESVINRFYLNMIIFIFIVGIVLFLTWTLICYNLARFITRTIGRLTSTSWVTGKVVVIVMSIFIAFLPFFYLFTLTGPKNYTSASIQPCDAGFKITVRGKRMLMVHDPISALLNHTYEDSASFIVPRQQGMIPRNELQILKDNCDFGIITIDGKQMNVRLFYDSLHDYPNGWNGKYYLKAP